MAHLRALGFEACAVFYNVSAAYLALLQPAAALPYLCKARMLALARPCRWKWPSCAYGTTLAHRRRNHSFRYQRASLTTQ